MKRNVDLSESRMFTTPEEPTGVFKLLLDLIKVTKPWDFEHNPRKITCDFDAEISSRSLFAIGNKKEARNLGQRIDVIVTLCHTHPRFLGNFNLKTKSHIQ